jgi:hypothetical protein
MRKLVTLRTETGKRISVHLDNWGGGIDRLYRRWMLEPDGWHCVDTGEIAQRASLIFGRLSKRHTGANWRK